jgi:predicted nucleic acid-binding protein
VRRAVDTSVAVAAILADHEAHEPAAEALGSTRATIAHVAMETYSVLTRLPPPHRVGATTASGIVEARMRASWVTLSRGSRPSILSRLAEADVSGGATYDGLIGLTALEHELELLSCDHRAARTYRALGVRFRLIAA